MKKLCEIKTLYITNLGLLDNLAQTQILPYLFGLSKKGLKILILSFEKKKYLEDKSKIEELKKKLEEFDIDWESLVYHSRWGNIIDLFCGLTRIVQIVRREGISLLHARASIPVLMAFPAAKLFRIKIIYDSRGTMVGDFVDDVNVRNVFSIRLFTIILNAIDRFIIRHSSATIVLSEKKREILKRDGYISSRNTILETIPCCVDVSRFDGIELHEDSKFVDLDGKFIMGYFGSLGTCYLLKEMAAFFKLLKKRIKNALFLIVSHTEKIYIEGVLKKETLTPGADYIIVNAEPDEVPKYITKCNISIMFIKPVLCKMGSSPTKFAESLAGGIPIIVNSGIGDTEEIIRNNKVGKVIHRFDRDTYEEAVDDLLKLLSDPELSKRCRLTAEKFLSLDKAINKYASIYESLAEKA